MPTWPPLHVVGISHLKADLGLRERFVRSRSGIATLLAGNGERCEGVVLSTCNRFEIYWWGDRGWLDWFHTTAEEQGVPLPPAAVVNQEGASAARHLFRVAAGLESQVVGEAEILGQVRRAWELAQESDATSRELDLVFGCAVAAGQRVRRETSIGKRRASIGSVAVDFARRQHPDGLTGREVLVLGTGQAARTVLAALQNTGARVRLSSRSSERATRQAAAFSATPSPWELLDQALGEVDLVFAATSAPTPVLSTRQLEAARGDRVAITVIDLGVPRNVEPSARGLAGIRVVDLDDLRAIDSGDSGPPLAALEAACDVVEDEVLRLLERLDLLARESLEPISGAVLPAGVDNGR